MSHYDKSVFESNRRRLFELLPDNSALLLKSADMVIRTGDTPYPFCQDRNFYYLTGYDNRQAAILLKRTGNTLSTHMFVIQLTPLQIHWLGYLPSPEEVKALTGINSVRPIADLPTALVRLLLDVDTLYLDYPPVAIDRPLSEIHQLARKIQGSNPHVRVKRANPLMAQLREVKEEWEINRIKKAVEVTHSGLTRILKYLKPGVREFELDAWFRLELNLQKTSVAFPSIVANGKNATILHYNTLDDSAVANDLILFDLGAEYLNYSADISRTFPVSGKFNKTQRELYTIVLDANKKAIDAVKPGVTPFELNELTKRVLAEGMMTLGYINNAEEIGKYYTHGVSHSLGLDTHDIQSGNHTALAPGMVLTIEPGLYLSEKGIGIRIEDDIVVTENGGINLSDEIPKEISDVETWIKTAQSRGE